jgi:hypothetical protein
MKAEDLEIENTYIVEKIDLIGSQLCEVRIMQKLNLTMQIEVDGSISKWISYEEFDKNWKVIEHYRDLLETGEYQLCSKPKKEKANSIVSFASMAISLVFVGSFIIFGIIIKTLFF